MLRNRKVVIAANITSLSSNSLFIRLDGTFRMNAVSQIRCTTTRDYPSVSTRGKAEGGRLERRRYRLFPILWLSSGSRRPRKTVGSVWPRLLSLS